MSIVRSSFLAALTLVSLTACSGTTAPTGEAARQGVVVEVTPESVSVSSGVAAAFDASVTGAADTSVRWSVLEGSPSGGSVSAAGLYTAPGTPGTYHVVATSSADATKSATATVRVAAGYGGGAGAGWEGGEYVACRDEQLRSQGVHYYCDCQAGRAEGCVAGNDGNPGTTSSAPRRTVGNAIGLFGGLAAGETIAFCRGGSFAGDGGYWTNSNGTAGNPVIVRDYPAPWSSGTEGRPIINGQLSLHGPANGYRLLNLRLAGSGSGYGVLAVNGVNDVTYCNLEIEGFEIGIYANTTLRNAAVGTRFLNNSSQGWLGNGTGNEVRDGYFWNNGYSNSMFDHSIYFGGSTLSQNEVIANNEIHPPANAGGVVVAAHGPHRYMLVEGNVITFDGGAGVGGWGISLQRGYSVPEYNSDTIIRGNKVVNSGNVGISATSCQRCLVENNVVINTTQGINAIAVPNSAADTGKGDPVSQNVTIRNNTVYLTAGGTGIVAGLEGSGHVVANNAVSVSGGSTCYSFGGGMFSERDYNLCYGGSGASPGAHSLTTPPMFVSAPSNLAPATGSPLIGAGDPAQTPAFDVTGGTRPVPGAIGAYEP
jgi:parallel beta-helix repeat protein